MSDRLREAIDSFRNDAAKQWLYENPKVEVLLAAARRFLALTETGPDYEAAIPIYNEWWLSETNPHEKSESLESMVRRAIDAALADYLTEEETE